jgi:disulfide bond formation protein DsbB
MQIYELLQITNVLLAVGALVVAIDGLVLLSDVWCPWIPDRARAVISRIAPWYAGIILLGAIGGPFVYQLVFAFPPCLLCWYNRIATWPAVVIMAHSMVRGTIRHTYQYIIGFTLVALIIGIVHYMGQFGVVSSLPCDATGQAVSCTGVEVLVWNFMTIPLMAVFAGIGMVGLTLWVKKYHN